MKILSRTLYCTLLLLKLQEPKHVQTWVADNKLKSDECKVQEKTWFLSIKCRKVGWLLNLSFNLETMSMQGTCSAAVGSRSNIACAALLFLTVIAAANGVAPALSRMLRLSTGWDNNNDMIVWCWFSIAMCNGVFPSTSLNHKHRQAFGWVV